jgi:isopentenyl diphosphate isomerase/L-lactate dehydrogenase-like FMN-dependent dehydrogenase
MLSHRREFLRFLAASPLFAGIPFQQALSQAAEPLIANPGDALNVFEFEAVARQKVPPAHFGYMASGVDDDETLKANRDAFSKYQVRARRLIDVSRIDMSTELFGVKWDSPIALAPVGSTKALYAEGEVGVAKAAQAKRTLQVLSTQASSSIEDVTTARGGPVWFQLYTTGRFENAQQMVKRAQKAGSPVVCVTVDTPAGRNTETQARMRRLDTRQCANCHTGNNGGSRPKPMFEGIDMSGTGLTSASLTPDYLKRLKDITTMKVVVKGIETGEDAAACVANGADGIYVSNHGGRSHASGRGTIDCLAEVVKAVNGRVPVMIDGGFRRGSDVFKALAMGANAVFIGRPYLWGAAAFGQPGVERVIDILRRELNLMMGQCGIRSLKELTPGVLVKS